MDESRALLIQRDSDKPNNGLKSTISSESYEDSAQFQLKEQDQYVTYGAINHVIYDYFHVLLLNSTIYWKLFSHLISKILLHEFIN